MRTPFDSYYWKEAEVGDERLWEARYRLAWGQEGEDDFVTLLRSGDPVALGVAFDHYDRAESMRRFGGRNPYEVHEGEILERARTVLAGSPCSSSETGASEDAANHASALLVMTYLADLRSRDDVLLVSAVLRRALTPNLIESATRAAFSLIVDEAPFRQEILDAFAEVLLDETRSEEQRMPAIRALEQAEGTDVGAVLARVMKAGHGKISMEAALSLANWHLAAHRSDLEQYVASWPADAEYPKADFLAALHEAVDGDG
ncbi:hypothetical protein SAMN06297387_110178 [Streptomyces zhaozhouensis]|uniref:HEAT repeat-containing protein n=1 Tax=Streptomyces zhaozhouensis TaxID=1300267 RepID=A0A286DXU0_9ACTN|nr:hypothetical protein [Streptomyces zhaozhouensis]SOD63446.1 hypothetical protein SAMN06297387_110178 [Streptomyces zhaozhouensis]